MDEKEITHEEDRELVPEVDGLDGEHDAPNAEAALKKLRERLKTCETEKQEYLFGWQRERADFANAKKVEAKEREEFIKFATEKVLADFLSVADSFEIAFAHKESWEKVDPDWRRGVESIYAQLGSVFGRYDLQRIGMVGERFNPRTHVAAGMIETKDKDKDDTVLEVTAPGYVREGKIIRPAKVIIGHYE